VQAPAQVKPAAPTVRSPAQALAAPADDEEELEDLEAEDMEESVEESLEPEAEPPLSGGGDDLIARTVAAAAKDADWTRLVDGFLHRRVLGYESLSKGAMAKLHGEFQEVVDEVLEALLERIGVGGEELLQKLLQMSLETLDVPPAHRARALQMLALDSQKALHALMTSEGNAAKADQLRRAALAAGVDAAWQSAVRAFHAKHKVAFVDGDGSSGLEWAALHEEYQVECEEKLEAVMGRAHVDPEFVMTKLMASVAELASSIAPPGVTPLPSHAWLPLRAFVEYQAFEQMMKGDMAAWEA